MTKKEAQRVVGNQPAWALQNMCVALALHSWTNRPEDWRRLEAACALLGNRAPLRARKLLRNHKTEIAQHAQ